MRISDGSSDVCSSDLCANPIRTAALRPPPVRLCRTHGQSHAAASASLFAAFADRGGRTARGAPTDRKSVVEGKSVAVRVDLGGRRIIKKKKVTQSRYKYHDHRTNKKDQYRRYH